MKLNLTTGLVPNLNVSVALLGFVFIRAWTTVLAKAKIVSTPFTKQENTIIQTCAVACYSIAVGEGFTTKFGLKSNQVILSVSYIYLVSQDDNNIYSSLELSDDDDVQCMIEAFQSQNVMPIMKLYAEIGMQESSTFSLENLSIERSPLITRDEDEDDEADEDYHVSLSCESIDESNEDEIDGCEPSDNEVEPDVIVIVQWGLKGEWFPASIPESSMKSLNGYKVFISIALILGDGLYNFVKVLYFTATNIHATVKKKNINKFSDNQKPLPLDDLRRNEVFARESIPIWLASAGYILFSIISIIVIPLMFHQLKWYYVVFAYLFAPSLGFCNAYGAGLTDMNMAYNYGKVALFVLAALAGKSDGVVAGLVGCGLIKSIVSISSDLMHDFKTGHLTFTSPRSILISQAIGTAIGCVVAPLTFFLFYKAFDVGNPNGDYKAPYAIIYRNMAILGVEGFSALPQHCLQLCYGFFAFAIAANLVRDLAPQKVGKWIPLPMAMAVPFLVGGYFAIDMCMGSLVVFIWHTLNTNEARLMVPAVASGLICGDGLWILPSSILALLKIRPPICMSFLSAR
uniref:Metal-nicotianamine transporter YSL3 n=1 Tax=Cajanus cajan TaxID=3821 RepID=A0A151S718_CAJCA|nr:Metal-nicotianamine transporter YSL3 [Cajanus cajan]